MSRVTSILTGGGARRIIIAGGLLIAVTLAGAGLSLRDLYNNAIDASRENTANLGIVTAEELSRSLEAVDLVLSEATQRIAHSGAAAEESRREMAGEATHDFLVNRLQALPQLNALFLTDKFGIQVNSSNFWPVPSTDLANHGFFKDAAKADGGTLVISTPAKAGRRDGGRCSSPVVSKAAPASSSAPCRRRSSCTTSRISIKRSACLKADQC